jgi:hypothetical protein
MYLNNINIITLFLCRTIVSLVFICTFQTYIIIWQDE